VGNFLNLGAMGFWWSTTIDNISGLPLYWIMYNNESDVGSSVENKNSGLSVRCVRDN
jgi:Na+-driven multidrug efflux pump